MTAHWSGLIVRLVNKGLLGKEKEKDEFLTTLSR